ncbi:MAG: hypothetical protein HY343_01695 [Lentisphaerae bacterium]|nr:hypothetical protein [Lentisphaerota bacterium]
MTNAARYFGDNLQDTSRPVAGQEFGYGFDNIGNRTQSEDARGVSDYTANQLNQYSERTVPPKISVLGSATTQAVVRVNDELATV